MTFKELKLHNAIQRVLAEINYNEPTEIQAKAIPLILDGKDVLACAQTGTGKTAAFALPIIHNTYLSKKASNNTACTSLIITPTRELAIQIGENIKTYSKYTNLKHMVIFGGVKQNKQVNRLRQGTDILVATPGRLIDLISQGIVSLKNIEYFVLDEADRMLDMGFINDIKKILKYLPHKKQSLFFSATLPPNIIELSKSILHHPKSINVAPVSSSAETVEQFVYYTNRDSKKDLLLKILKNPEIDEVLIFTRTKRGADRLCKNLQKKKVMAMAIHGDKSQNQRQKALGLFKNKELKVLVATDIAARGIDIDQLEHVINYDVPNEPETYVHRIGRSGRAGNTGIAISLSEPEENQYIKDIEKLISKKLKVVSKHDFPQTDKPMTASEKKEWNKEKQLRKQKFFESRRKRATAR